jgi:microcin C transport system substrate-binding protein
MKLLYVVAISFLVVAVNTHASNGFAQFGEPKYPAGFQYFDYVNPNAPKGGELNLSNTGVNSSFDKFNPFNLKGRPAPGLLELVFETLAIYSLDEPNTHYGLLAEDIQVADDFSWVQYRLRKNARFSNHDPVLAEDVKYSFDTLTSPKASPAFSSYFSEIERADIIDELRIRFTFKRKGRDLVFVAGSLPVFSPKWGITASGERIPFENISTETPIGSGPYQIEKAIQKRTISYKRDEGYWGKDLPVRRGTLNFDHVNYKLYKDRDTQVSALRSGDYDVFSENQMRYWCCQYIGKRFDSGELKKELFPHKNPGIMTGYAYNLRREKFQDVRVRKALIYAFDFDWVNQKIFDNYFNRVSSYFFETPLQAKGLPSAAELAILEPYKDQLDPAVFGEFVKLPATKPAGNIRENLIHAKDLLEQAGWVYRDGALRNSKNEIFTIEVSGSRGPNLLLDGYYFNLKKLGIVVEERTTDAATSRNRLKNFDYDFTNFGLREARIPGAELWRTFNSKAASQPGSDNVVGVKSTVIDDLIKRLMNANSQPEAEAIGKALDRVLMHGWYIQPWRYLSDHYVVYHSRLRRPETLPIYYNANEWMIATWWDSTASKSNPLAKQ